MRRSIYDARYDAERWMHEHVRDGERSKLRPQRLSAAVSAAAEVTRVAPTPNRGPLPGVTEMEQPYEE